MADRVNAMTTVTSDATELSVIMRILNEMPHITFTDKHTQFAK